MHENAAKAVIGEALMLGLTLVAKGYTGDCISVGLACVRTSRRRHIVCEYLVSQQATGDRYITLSLSEAVKLAFEYAGQRIANEAVRQIKEFMTAYKINKLS